MREEKYKYLYEANSQHYYATTITLDVSHNILTSCSENSEKRTFLHNLLQNNFLKRNCDSHLFVRRFSPSGCLNLEQ